MNTATPSLFTLARLDAWFALSSLTKVFLYGIAAILIGVTSIGIGSCLIVMTLLDWDIPSTVSFAERSR